MSVLICIVIVILAMKSASSMEGRIMNGGYVRISEYPHQVFLELYGLQPAICGGSILNQAIVLTAAHCFGDLDRYHNEVYVLYGSNNIDHMTSEEIKSYVIHEYFDVETMTADIALARCSDRIKLGQLVKRIAVMPKPPGWSIAYVAGWGAMNEHKYGSDILKHAKQEIQSYKVCSPLSLPEGTFCAGPVLNSGTPSIGDSGGALIIDKYIQIGIVSYRVSGYKPVAYTNVSYYYSWIFNNSAYLYCRRKNH